jgi:hypothetical protein
MLLRTPGANDLPYGQVIIRGAFNHPDAAACAQPVSCQLQFVVNDIQPVE